MNKLLNASSIKFIAILTACILLTPLFTQSASAVTRADWNASNIIDDVIFFNPDRMSTQDIQNFLNAKVPTCDTNGEKMYNSTQTRAQWAHANGRPLPPYTCLKNFTQTIPGVAPDTYCSGSVGAGTKSAATIIKEVSLACNINPQVILVTLQKEQSLITDDWPWPVQYTKATGMGCPDTSLGVDVDSNQNGCYDDYEGFFKQIYYGARQFQRYVKQPDIFNYAKGRNSYIAFQANNAGCGGTYITPQSHATAALYNYTPYQPNAAALDNMYGTGDACSAYGNRNFWRIFNDWFGSTMAFVHEGVNYGNVFDPVYYLNNNPDVQEVYGTYPMNAFLHFLDYGMKEGRRGNEEFDVTSYRNRHQDLRMSYRTNLPSYYKHYTSFGKMEGRIASGAFSLIPITNYGGKSYLSVYDYSRYLEFNADMRTLFINDDAGAIEHFVTYGMKESRLANLQFNVTSYRSRYFDLRRVFGADMRQYFTHFIYYGQAENRSATGNYIGGTSIHNGVNYSSIYLFNKYRDFNSDIVSTYQLDDIGAIQHFINFGMKEGRQANSEFNVSTYKARYPDLRAAYGDRTEAYYMHYLYYGKAEGRSAN